MSLNPEFFVERFELNDDLVKSLYSCDISCIEITLFGFTSSRKPVHSLFCAVISWMTHTCYVSYLMSGNVVVPTKRKIPTPRKVFMDFLSYSIILEISMTLIVTESVLDFLPSDTVKSNTIVLRSRFH